MLRLCIQRSWQWHLQVTLCDVSLCTQRFVFTEDAQEITFHFLDTSVFHFSSKYSKAGTENFEIAGAESLKVHKGPEVREYHTFVSACCHSSVTLCYRN